MTSTDIPRPEAPAQAPALGYLLLVCIGLFWGVNWPAIKISVGEIPVWWFRAISLTGGSVGLLIIGWASSGRLLPYRSEIWPLLVCTVFVVLGWHICSAFGVSLMPAGRASIIAYLMPVFASILAVPVLGERMTWLKVVGLILGIAGLLVLIGPDIAAMQAAPLGAMFMLGSALSWALGTVLFKKFQWQSTIAVITGWQLALGLVVILPIAVISGPAPDPMALSTDVWLAMAYLVALPMIFCQWAYLKVVTIFPAAIAAIGTLSVPIVGVYSSAIILGEPVGWAEFTALLLISAALAVVLILPALQRSRKTG